MYKIIKVFIMSLVCSFSINTTYAKEIKVVTDTITIRGNCGDCKERIEEASYVKGVKSATWDKKTKILTVVYNASKTNLEKITKAISKVGHDSKYHTATDKDYNKLPGCCAYRTGVCAHE